MMPENERIPISQDDDESYEDPIDEQMGSDGEEGNF